MFIVHDGPTSSEYWEGLPVYHLHFRVEIPKKDAPTAHQFPIISLRVSTAVVVASLPVVPLPRPGDFYAIFFETAEPGGDKQPDQDEVNTE